MSVRVQLKWLVPRPSWELLERNALDKKGSLTLYAGIEVEQIADLWLAIEETDGSTLDLPTRDPPHTQKTNATDTPLSEEEKVEVHAGIHQDTKERLRLAADEYDVNPGVLLGYIIREYYETDGWGYSVEAVGTDPTPTADTTPTSRCERLKVICDRLDTAENDDLLADDVQEVIANVAGPSVVDGSNGYLSDVLDRIGYVHHPDADHLYMSAERREELFGITPSDPPVERKPWSALDKSERVESIKDYLARTGKGMQVSAIHTEIFDGNGSMSYMRNLAQEVAASEPFDFRKTPGGKKILRCTGEYAPVHASPAADDQDKQADQEDEDETDGDRERLEDETDAQMDALMNAQPARTDGGQDEPEQ